MLIHLMLTMLAGLFLAVVGVYFLTWAIKAKGLWCRNCKRFPAGGP